MRDSIGENYRRRVYIAIKRDDPKVCGVYTNLKQCYAHHQKHYNKIEWQIFNLEAWETIYSYDKFVKNFRKYTNAKIRTTTKLGEIQYFSITEHTLN